MEKHLFQDAAVLLNANARKVTRKLMARTEEMVPQAQLYISHSFDDAKKALGEIMEKKYGTVFCGGGDGTIVNTITQLKHYIDEKNRMFHDAVAHYHFPDLGVLKLGTGNALTGLIGNLKGIEPLRSLQSGLPIRRRRINLIETERTHSHFAGIGWDAAIINDYNWMRNRFGHLPLFRQLTAGFQGYISSMAMRTIPREFFSFNRPQVRVINEGDKVYRMRLGQPPELADCKTGETLYEGRVSICGAATTPYYGFNLVAYPFAGMMEGFMNFRLIRSGVTELVVNSPRIFKGRFQGKNFFDYLMTKVRLEFDRPMPFQIGGDGYGYRDSATFSISDLSVNLLDFSQD